MYMMNTVLLSFVAVTFLLTSAIAIVVQPQGSPHQSSSEVNASEYPSTYYGYVTINESYDSAMFYALHGRNFASSSSTSPLVMFLQGGPGASSLFSDYLETGPQALVPNKDSWYKLVNRSNTWTQYANMLYVDNPVGTGFSYSKDPRGLSTTDEEIAENLLTFLKGFYEKHPEYKKNKLSVIGESYGGKMAAYFGARLVEEIKKKTMNIKFIGVGLGDAWIDPIGCMYSYADYLSSLGQCEEREDKEIRRLAAAAQNALQAGDGKGATRLWGKQQQYISNITGNLNWYNIDYYYEYMFTAEYQLRVFLTTKFLEIPEVKRANIKHKYGSQNDAVFAKMSKNFMNDAIPKVDYLLAEGYKVTVYHGQYDLIVNPVCTLNWVNKLQWTNLSAFNEAYRWAKQNKERPYEVRLFYQKYRNFETILVNKAGHMVPRDQPESGEYVIDDLLYSSRSPSPSPSPSTPAAPHTPIGGTQEEQGYPQRLRKIDDIEFVALP